MAVGWKPRGISMAMICTGVKRVTARVVTYLKKTRTEANSRRHCFTNFSQALVNLKSILEGYQHDILD